MRTLVVTRYDENLSWLDNIKDDVIIYNKGFPLLPYEFKELPNVGREADSMLYHIVNNYHSLSDELVFLQGDPFDHCWDLLKLLEEKRNVEDVVWLGSNWGPVTKNYDGGPGHGCYLPMLKISKLLFENCQFDKTTTFTFSAGAQYIVPRHKITSKSLDWWTYSYKIFTDNLPTTPWVYERLWPLIWDYTTKS